MHMCIGIDRICVFILKKLRVSQDTHYVVIHLSFIVHLQICIYVYKHMYVYIHTFVCIYIHTCIYVCR